jgi:hypothetical protein
MPGGSLAAELPDLRLSVLEVADRLLERGTVVTGEATISVAGVDLIYLGLNVVLTAVANLERAGSADQLSSRAQRGIPVLGGPEQSPVTGIPRGAVQWDPSIPTGLGMTPEGELTSRGEAPANTAAPGGPGIPDAQAQAVEAVPPGSLDLDPERVEQGLAKLVLTLVELLRQLLERQGLRRMEGGTLTDEEVERMGLAFMRLEARVRDMSRQFGLDPDDLNLSLGPIGDLM